MTRTFLDFTVPGRPVPCPRPRIKWGHKAYYPQRYEDWRVKIQLAALEACQKQLGTARPCWTGPIELGLIFVGAAGNADLSNLVKSIEDASEGILMVNDRQITKLQAERFRVEECDDPEEGPHVVVNVRRVLA